MPTSAPIEKILIIGSGPVKIHQTASLDNAACQACEVFKHSGLRTVMVHCDPSAIATDMETTDRTYMMPLTEEVLIEIIRKEKPDSLLPSVGGPAAMSLAKALFNSGITQKMGIRLLGITDKTLALIDDPASFSDSVSRLGLMVPQGQSVDNIADAANIAEKMGYPVFVRTSGLRHTQRCGIVYNVEELHERLSGGRLAADATDFFRIEQNLSGYREIEVQLLRDAANRMALFAMAENIDPVGVHSGDSATVIPAMTLDADTCNQIQDAAFMLAEHAAVTGVIHLKFAVSQNSDEVLVLSMKPMVTDLTALCTRAFGTSLTTIHTELAMGRCLDEIQAIISPGQEGTHENTVVVYLPCWEFERFPGETACLDASKKSTGAVMGLGRSFLEALQKASHSRTPEEPVIGLHPDVGSHSKRELMRGLVPAAPHRLARMVAALKSGVEVATVASSTGIHKDWISQLALLADLEAQLAGEGGDIRSPSLIKKAAAAGFSAAGMARLSGIDLAVVERFLADAGIENRPRIFSEAPQAPYSLGHAQAGKSRFKPLGNSILIIGPAFGRIGQNIEQDHSCIHGARALRALGRRVIAVNANPVSACGLNDVDRIYTEAVTNSDIKAICRWERPEGIILQFGGFRAMGLADELTADGFDLLGTAMANTTLTQDRLRFSRLLTDLGIAHPPVGIASSPEQAMDLAESIGYPLVAIPQASRLRKRRTLIMEAAAMEQYVMNSPVSGESSIMLEHFLEYAIEVEADALCDGKSIYVPAAMEHIELAGVHSGDAAIVVPPYSTAPRHVETIGTYIQKIALELDINGLLNTRFAVLNDTVYLLEARPWACRSLPLVSKICDVPMAQRAVQVMMGKHLTEMDLPRRLLPHYGIRSSVFPFDTFSDTDPLLGPRMRSTGQAMTMASVFGMAYFHSQEAADTALPLSGTVLITVTDADKPSVLEPARLFKEMGFGIQATRGTHSFLMKNGIEAQLVKKLGFGRPDLVDGIKTGEVALVVNTPSGRQSQQDDAYIRKTAIRYRIPNITTPAGALAAAKGIAARKQGHGKLCTLQAYVNALK